MTDFIKKGDDPTTAYEKAKGQYGRVADAVKIIDPRQEESKISRLVGNFTLRKRSSAEFAFPVFTKNN